MTTARPFENATDDALIAELRARGIFVSAWNNEDFIVPIDEDEDLTEKDEAFVRRATELFAERAQDGMADILGTRGNDYLSDKWSELRDEIIAQVEAETAPSAGPSA